MNSSLWRNKESHNTLGGKERASETKLPTYWSTPLSEICLVKAGVVYPTMVISDYQALSLYSALFVIVVFFVRHFGSFDASVRHFVLSIQAVSVFIEFSTRYCGISRFFPRYCGSEYPPPPNVPSLCYFLLCSTYLFINYIRARV